MPMGQEHDARPTISLCLIVRDEAELLPQFLKKAAGLWDELCVVDTGSQDDTIAILRAAGAKIVERAWDDDFSAARNASLAMATGTWIIFLDADEMLSPEAVAGLRAVTRDPSIGATTVRMVNPLPHASSHETQLLRMFRNDPGIRFQHRIHEEVASTVEAYLRRTGLALAHLDAPIEHLGYVRERAAGRDKKARDSRLLRRAVAENPADFYSWFKLLELARFWSDDELGRNAAEAAHEALKAAGCVALAGKRYAADFIVLLASYRFPEAPAEAIVFARSYAPYLELSPTFHLRIGEWQERLGQIAEAVESFGACLALADKAHQRDTATVRPLMGLARIALAQPYGIEEAWAFTERALVHNHRDPEALHAATSICRIAGGEDLVAQFVRDYTGKFGETPELTHALAAG
jgi:glycosyltransferase involved in cell wall biosynthesis